MLIRGLRAVLLSFVVIGSALALAACGGGSEDDDAAPASTDAPADTEAPTTTDAPTTDAPTTTEPPTTTEAPTTTTEAPPPEFEYSDRGEFGVGVATVTIDDDTERPLTVDVWFPLAAGTTGDAEQYTLIAGVYYESPSAISADLDTIADGTFPLVVYSHGSGGQRWIHSDYTEFIASHGYVVVAPDHTGNTLIERFAGAEIDVNEVAFNRVSDVISLIDASTGADATEPLGEALAGHITDDLIITGHSFGGFTSYAAISGVESDLGVIEADDRIDALITLAPATGGLSDEQLAAVDVPHLVMVGDSDDVTPVDPNVERAWASVTGSPSYRVELVAAEHQSFTDLCNYQRALPQLEGIPEFVIDAIDAFAATDCVATAMSVDRVQVITNGIAIRFLDEVTEDGDPLTTDVNYGPDVRFAAK